MDTPLKRCPKCKREFPATPEFFNRSSGHPGGLYPWCKVCKREDGKKRYASDPEKHKSRVQQYREANHNEIIERRHQQYRENREAMARRQREYRTTHLIVLRAYDRRRNALRTPDEIKRDKEYLRQYRKRNGEYLREKSKEIRKRQIHIRRASHQRRSAKKRQLPSNFLTTDWLFALNYFGGCCAYCGNQPGLFTNMRMTADHVIPLSDPGCPGTVPHNMVPACQACNSSKNKRDASQWLHERFGKKKGDQILGRIKVFFALVRKMD